MDGKYIAKLILAGFLLSLPVECALHKRAKIYNNLPLTTGIVVEKVKSDKNNLKTIFSIDTDDNKDTIEKVMTITEYGPENILTINAINEGSKIKFKDTNKKNNKLSQEYIYQIDDLIIRHR